MDEYQELLASLVSIGSEMFRFRGVFERVLMRLGTDEQMKYASQYAWFEKRVMKALTDAGIRIIDFQGKVYDPGLPVTPLNLEDFAPEDELFVQQTIEPVMMKDEKLLKTGTVILGRIEKQ